MPKPIVFIAALLLALTASAQTLLPARQVSVNTNGTAWTSIAPTATTAQASFDWIDANWGALDASGFATMPTNLSTYQLAFDWLDANLDPGLSTNAWLFLKPSNATSQATFDFIDAYMGIDTNDWGYLAPTASTVQATFTWLDDRFFGFDPEAVIMPGSNIVGAALVSNQWTGLMPGTNIVGAALVSNQWTGLMPGTNAMLGTNIYWYDYNSSDKTWYPRNTVSGGVSYISLGGYDPTAPTKYYQTYGPVAGTYYLLTSNTWYHSELDPGDWWNPTNSTMVFKESGLYLFSFHWVNRCCGARIFAKLNNSDVPGWGFSTGLWGLEPPVPLLGCGYTVLERFYEGDTFSFWYVADRPLSHTNNIGAIHIRGYLIGP